MALDPTVVKELNKLEHTPFHKTLLDLVVEQNSRSASQMSSYHAEWDKHAETIAGFKCADKEDIRATAKKEPSKMIVPTARAQLHTFVAFLFLYFQQRQYAFEYAPQDSDDFKIRENCEKLVDRDCRKSKWPLILYQFLLDSGRFNLGILEHSWVEETKFFPQKTVAEGTFAGIKFTTEEETIVPVKTFQGNRIFNISPYRFYPDPNVPLTRLHEGEFCGVEEEMSITQLKQMEAEGMVAGIDHIQNYDEARWKSSGRAAKRQRFVKGPIKNDMAEGMVAVLRHMVKIIPTQYLIDGKPLGKEDYPVVYIVWVANDNRVIRAEPSNYLHGEFNFEVGQFDTDFHNYISPGLPAVIDKLQEAISWFINSHILSVRRNLDHSLIFDPKFIDAKSLQSRSPMIPLKKSSERQRISDKVMQLQLTDVTGHHMQDAQMLIELTSLITGINEAALGSVSSGRRSATEHRAANQGASSRLRTVGAVLYNMGLGPLAHKLLLNLRQGLDRENYDRGVGLPSMTDPFALADHEESWMLFKADPAHLAAGADFFTLDAIDPNQKVYMAQAMGELFKVIMSMPDAAQAFDIDPGSVFKELMQLQGTGDVSRHSLRANMMKKQTIMQQMQQAQMQQAQQPIDPNGTEQPSVGGTTNPAGA